MQSFRNSFERSVNSENRVPFPVPAPGEKLKNSDTSKTQYFVKCVSSMPLASNTTKEQIRMNYLHQVIQGKINDPRFTRGLSLPKLPNPTNTGMAPTQPSFSPFSKPQGFPQPQQFQPYGPVPAPNYSLPKSNNPIPMNQSFPMNQNPFPTNTPLHTNPNNPLHTNPHNPFIKTNQLQTNHSSNQPKHFTAMSTLSPPGLVKQPSFGHSFTSTFTKTTVYGNTHSTGAQMTGHATQGLLNTQGFAGVGFTGINNSINPLAGSSIMQAPGLITSSPSFGTVQQSTQVQPGSMFGQSSTLQSQQTPLTTPNNPSILASHTSPLGMNTSAPSTNPPNSQSQPNSQPQQSLNTLDQNIKQLLDSKPNLWNILSLDPQYRYGYNENGRMYVKSVLQRIIDEKILSEESLSKVIIEIYKQLHGAQNFEKMLEDKKKQILYDDKVSDWKINEILGRDFNKPATESVFPKDIDSIGQDFYRSFKRTSTKFFDGPLTSLKRDEDEYKSRLERKFFQVKRTEKPMELKVQFVEINRPQKSAKVIESPYTSEGLDKISEAITELRNEHRRQIMPKEEELPDIEGFEISPSFQELRHLTRYQLLSVGKVTVSNEWGSVRFKGGISLLGKKLSECLTINKKSVEISDEEWKVRDAEITFKKFADFSQLEEEEQELLEEKIVAWCEREKFELVKVDRSKGQVVIEV